MGLILNEKFAEPQQLSFACRSMPNDWHMFIDLFLKKRLQQSQNIKFTALQSLKKKIITKAELRCGARVTRCCQRPAKFPLSIRLRHDSRVSTGNWLQGAPIDSIPSADDI
jgi:hypothetical protein